MSSLVEHFSVHGKSFVEINGFSFILDETKMGLKLCAQYDAVATYSFYARKYSHVSLCMTDITKRFYFSLLL